MRFKESPARHDYLENMLVTLHTHHHHPHHHHRAAKLVCVQHLSLMTHSFKGVITASWETLEFWDPTEIICLNNRLFHLDLSVLEWCRGGMSDCLKVSNREIRGPRWKKTRGGKKSFIVSQDVDDDDNMEYKNTGAIWVEYPRIKLSMAAFFHLSFAFSREMFLCKGKKKTKSSRTCLPSAQSG